MAKWQKDKFESLVANLPLNHVICVHDFSENYTCCSQGEIHKLSIHVTILYCHADLQAALSDDYTQDYHFVHHVQNLILTHLREQHHLTVDKIRESTDGSAGQYKSKHTFGDLSCCLADFGCQIDRPMPSEIKMQLVLTESREPPLLYFKER